jgi:hypothetical protein
MSTFAGGGVHLVVVPVDCSENKRVLAQELKANPEDKKSHNDSRRNC